MIKDSNLTIQKLEAARSQLQTAIQLWFADGDPISIHTLTCAAHQILHDMHVQRGGAPLLFDSIFVKDGRLAEWNRGVKAPMNFFKHADRDANGTMAFDPSLTECFLMMSLYLIEGLDTPLTLTEAACAFWCVLHNPDWLNMPGQDRFINCLPVDELAYLRHISKQRFYSMYKLLW